MRNTNQAIEDYPHTNAVLVRRHGVYVWGKNWQAAKTMWDPFENLNSLDIKI